MTNLWPPKSESYPRFDDILFSFFRVIYVMSMTSNVYFHHWMKCFLINQGGVCDIFPITLVIYETSKTLQIMRPGENCFQSVEGLSGSWNNTSLYPICICYLYFQCYIYRSLHFYLLLNFWLNLLRSMIDHLSWYVFQLVWIQNSFMSIECKWRGEKSFLGLRKYQTGDFYLQNWRSKDTDCILHWYT